MSDICADCNKWVAKSDICVQVKYSSQRPHVHLVEILVSAPFERLPIDILGKLPKLLRDNK